MRTLVLVIVAATLSAPAIAQEAGDILSRAERDGHFDTFLGAVEATGLTGTLSGEGPFTVFAPNNSAFAALTARERDALMDEGNSDRLEAILTYHVAGADLAIGDLADGDTIETVNGEALEVAMDGDTVRIGGALIVGPDIRASNGVIHEIDTVLTPPDAR